MEFIYENNRGKKINLSKRPYFLNIEPMFDYSWDYTKRERRRGDIIAGFTKTVSTKDLVLHIGDKTESIRNNAIDEFNSVIESDIYDGVAGKIWVGDWFTYGYIVAANNEKWQYGTPIVKKTITLAREQDSWYRKIVKKSYEENVIHVDVESWCKNYESCYDYKYDYMTDFDTSVQLVNPDALPSNFILTIQGPAERPEIHIGDKVVQFNLDVPDGASLQINSMTKTAILTFIDGRKFNAFGSRNPDYYLFERIPSGINAVTWNGSFVWEITLIEERSEPRWLTV